MPQKLVMMDAHVVVFETNSVDYPFLEIPRDRNDTLSSAALLYLVALFESAAGRV